MALRGDLRWAETIRLKRANGQGATYRKSMATGTRISSAICDGVVWCLRGRFSGLIMQSWRWRRIQHWIIPVWNTRPSARGISRRSRSAQSRTYRNTVIELDWIYPHKINAFENVEIESIAGKRLSSDQPLIAQNFRPLLEFKSWTASSGICSKPWNILALSWSSQITSLFLFSGRGAMHMHYACPLLSHRIIIR